MRLIVHARLRITRTITPGIVLHLVQVPLLLVLPFALLLRLVYINDGIGIGIRSERSLAIVCKSKNRVVNGIGIGRIRRFCFYSDSASASVAYDLV